MSIENCTNLPEKSIGRPLSYPFGELKPGQMLTVKPGDYNLTLKELRQKIASSLFHFKRNNGHTWDSAIRTKNGNIIVYRLN